jgi:hypothetical protein
MLLDGILHARVNERDHAELDQGLGRRHRSDPQAPDIAVAVQVDADRDIDRTGRDRALADLDIDADAS